MRRQSTLDVGQDDSWKKIGFSVIQEQWVHTFEFFIHLQEAVLLFVEWCSADVSVLCVNEIFAHSL